MWSLAPMQKARQTVMYLQSQSWGNRQEDSWDSLVWQSSRIGESLVPLRDLVSEVDGVPENDNQDYSLASMSTCMCNHGTHACEHTQLQSPPPVSPHIYTHTKVWGHMLRSNIRSITNCHKWPHWEKGTDKSQFSECRVRMLTSVNKLVAWGWVDTIVTADSKKKKNADSNLCQIDWKICFYSVKFIHSIFHWK